MSASERTIASRIVSLASWPTLADCLSLILSCLLDRAVEDSCGSSFYTRVAIGTVRVLIHAPAGRQSVCLSVCLSIPARRNSCKHWQVSVAEWLARLTAV